MSASPRRVLVVFAHPSLETSRVNRRLLHALDGLEGVTLHDLYEVYPDFDVEVEREQALWNAHDLVVLQHPFYWYSMPALLKEWIDLVLAYGWAYGPGGDALVGKEMLSAITTGSRADSYGPEGGHRFTVRQFLAPVEQTARLCGMGWLPPFVVHGTNQLGPMQIESAVAEYRAALVALRDRTLDLDAVRGLERLNLGLASCVRS